MKVIVKLKNNFFFGYLSFLIIYLLNRNRKTKINKRYYSINLKTKNYFKNNYLILK